jgi:two-component system, OmpR family, copper resistance phosphate regulon response regulator CusR
MTELSSTGHLQVISGTVGSSRGKRYRRAMRILVIEDEARILAFLARGLEAEGYAVGAAQDGREGLRLALAEAWDLVVLDLLLPAIDGLSVLRKLHLERPDLPVVILSARSELTTKLRSFDLGASDYVAKPFALDELLARVRAQLRRGTWGDDGNLVRVGGLVLDVARREARVAGGAPAGLSDREFRVLLHLAQHPGEIVSRERLLSEVWGYDFDPRSNVVEVSIRRVRQKLGADAPIETVRHAGYRLAAA